MQSLYSKKTHFGLPRSQSSDLKQIQNYHFNYRLLDKVEKGVVIIDRASQIIIVKKTVVSSYFNIDSEGCCDVQFRTEQIDYLNWQRNFADSNINITVVIIIVNYYANLN